MNDFYYGLEILVLGFVVVILALLLLAVILELFHRLFGDKPEKENVSAQPITSHTPLVVEKQPSGKTNKPELVAASIGAILYTMETGGHVRFAIKEVKALSNRRSNWSLGGRTNLLDARQDFVSMRRRKKR
jgi:Na+-transporting methylmalonyl-CoA/oxaloacetate decarboxylase gamma subunit